MAETRGPETVRRAFLAINNHDEETFLAVLHPEIEWHSRTRGLVGVDVWRGRDAVAQGRRAAGEGGRDVRTTLQEIRTHGDDVLVLGTVTAETPHRGRVTLPAAWIWTVRDGLAVRVESFPSRSAGLMAWARRTGGE